MNDKLKEDMNEALGFHPDSETDFVAEIVRLRQESRDNFHALTKAKERKPGWINEKEQDPPDGKDCYSHVKSILVMATDGKRVRVAVKRRWADSEYPSDWQISGSDGYGFYGVTHWMPLPSLPNVQAQR